MDCSATKYEFENFQSNSYSQRFIYHHKNIYEILDLGTGKAYAFDKNEPWTHIQDIFFLDNDNLSFILAANASITRYICEEKTK